MKRFDVYWVALDPTFGSEIKKTRPALIISPDEMNPFLKTVIVAPMTTVLRNYPSRVSVFFDGRAAEIILDQIRGIDKSRLIKKIGEITHNEAKVVSDILVEMFEF